MCTNYICMCYPQTDINSIQSTDYGEILSSITDITTLLCLLLSWLDELKVYVTGPAKIDYLSAKKSPIFSVFAVS